ncbi:carbohydrate ABC transporter permease [Kribbella sp.]|uniref:carbohydrate ABC transporter permease n=1 Tax=Kribbella sp. TaxID=1871183 RepID=UPI002D29D8D2|nr:carbohydrate ABC transporter permease [Kribbella sp.]HZX01463.1 carbohydrate ABC transporter permease [Kribbella sp.]
MKLSLGRTAAWVYLVLFLIVTLFPFYWIVRTALSNNYALLDHPSSLLPVDVTLGPFERVLGLATRAQAVAEGGSGATIQLGLYLRNSVIYATTLTVLVVFCSLLAAYAFARLQWRGRDVVFGVFLSALMIPGIMTLLPNFVLIHDLGLTNTFAGLILPGALFSAFGIFFLRQFLLGLPAEIEDAGLIDGLGRLQLLFRITVPMSQGPITTLALLTFINAWNDYFWPLMIAGNSDVRPLTVALGVFQQASPQTQPDFAGLMAAALVAAFPMLLLFVLFGRRIVDSIGFTGLR